MKKLLLILLIGAVQIVTAQNKKPLDHSVYDGWKSIGERLISNDGNFIAYTVNPQEGDGELVIQSPALQYKKTIARGYNAVITEDSRYLICKIKPAFQDTRQAKIKKKTGDEIPKDSVAIIELGKDYLLFSVEHFVFCFFNFVLPLGGHFRSICLGFVESFGDAFHVIIEFVFQFLHIIVSFIDHAAAGGFAFFWCQ